MKKTRVGLGMNLDDYARKMYAEVKFPVKLFSLYVSIWSYCALCFPKGQIQILRELEFGVTIWL